MKIIKMEFTKGNIQMPSSSVFSIPTKDNRQVVPSLKQQQLRLMAPLVSPSASAGHKRKLYRQMEDGDKDVQLHQQMNRDKRLRLDQQQTSSSSSIGLKKKSSIMGTSPTWIDSSFISSHFIHILASVQDKVMGIVAAWLSHSVTSQTPETKKSN